MRLKIAIAFIVAMFVIAPLSHWAAWKSGRVGIYGEVVNIIGVTKDKNIRVNGHVFTHKRVYLELLPTQLDGTCGNCHERIPGK